MSSGGFLATHVAPAGGLQAWEAPDPARPVIAQVQPGVRMQLLEQRGAWARVLFSNGWSGWVDGRRLVATSPPAAAPPQPQPSPPPQPQASQPPQQQPAQQQPQRPQQPQPDPFQLPQNRPQPGSPFAEAETQRAPERQAQAQPQPQKAQPQKAQPEQPQPRPQPQTAASRPSRSGTSPFENFNPRSPAPIGALVVLIGSLLPWISIKGFSGNAFRVPIAFLVDYKTQGSGLKVGLLLVAAAVVAGVFCVLPGRVNVRRIMGGVVVLIAVVYLIQLQRVLSAGGSGAPSLTSAIGFGVLIVIGGGIAVIVDTSEPGGEADALAEIEVTRTQPDRYKVVVGGTNSYDVTVPASVGIEGVDDETLVLESFVFLLEREPPSSILKKFSLDVIRGYFPEYDDEMRRRLGGQDA